MLDAKPPLTHGDYGFDCFEAARFTLHILDDSIDRPRRAIGHMCEKACNDSVPLLPNGPLDLLLCGNLRSSNRTAPPHYTPLFCNGAVCFMMDRIASGWMNALRV